MRKIVDRLNLFLFVASIIAAVTYPYLREYANTVYMPRYLIFHWYLLFPALAFSSGYLLYRVALIKATISMPTGWKCTMLTILSVVLLGYLAAAIVTIIHCHVPILPTSIADRLVYWMTMIYKECLGVFAVVGGLYSVVVW